MGFAVAKQDGNTAVVGQVPAHSDPLIRAPSIQIAPMLGYKVDKEYLLRVVWSPRD